MQELLKLQKMKVNPILHIFPFHNTSEPIIIAGPCSAETREQTLSTAHQLKDSGVTIFRAGLWKPRTMPGNFEGVGYKGLEWLTQVKRETGMLIATEVATPNHVTAAIDADVDIIWIGARTVTNPFAVQEISDELSNHNDITVLVKNPVNPDIDLWIGALLRIYNSGVKKIGAIHRGFGTYGNQLYRNSPQWHIPIELHRRFPNLPILCDPSHMGGKKQYIPTLSQYALDMGFNGLFIESHCDPDAALSDKEQQVTPSELKNIINSLIIRSLDDDYAEINILREQIDQCDNDLLELMSRRMSISNEIGKLKKMKKLQVVQTDRYDTILQKMTTQASKMGLSADFIKKLMTIIHEESVRNQIKILNEQS